VRDGVEDQRGVGLVQRGGGITQRHADAEPARDAAHRKTEISDLLAGALTRNASTRSQSIAAIGTTLPRGPQPSSTASTRVNRKSRRRGQTSCAMSSSTAATEANKPLAQARSMGASSSAVSVVGSMLVTSPPRDVTPKQWCGAHALSLGQ
jgi:hypothetical protein